jgi:acetyl esterase/lipase
MANIHQPPRTEKYGPIDDQIGDLYVPAERHPAVICLLHGGFWRIAYGRDQMTVIAQDLAASGFAVWNLEYRRTGSTAGGWPGTFEDVITGIEYLSQLTIQDVELDLNRVIVIGHSSGGHLALWAAAHNRIGRTGTAMKRVQIAAAVGLAPIADLMQAYNLGVGGSAIAELLGGDPSEQYSRYQEASPGAQLPLGVTQLIIHGTADEDVPIELSREYAQAARSAGDRVELIEITGASHMDFLDLSSSAYTALCDWLAHISGGTPSMQ